MGSIIMYVGTIGIALESKIKLEQGCVTIESVANKSSCVKK